MSKDQKEMTHTKDKDLSKWLNVANKVKEAMQDEAKTEGIFFDIEPSQKAEHHLKVLIDYERAYELAVSAFLELSGEVDMLTQGNEDVREAFTNKFEELHENVKMQCVQLNYE